MILFVNSCHRDVAMICKFFSMACFIQSGQERMFSWNCNYQVNIVIGSESIDRLKKIVDADKIKFRFIVTESFFHPVSFFLEFFRQLNVMLAIDIYDMKIGLEDVEDQPDLRHWCC